MNRRSFLKLAVGAAVILASGMELLEAKEKPLIWNPVNYKGEFEFRTIIDTFHKVSNEVWHERYVSEWRKLAAA